MIDNTIIASNITGSKESPIWDADSFIQRLFLFDNYILESRRLKEIPHLINLIGYEGLIVLLKSRILRIRCEFSGMGQVGQLKYKADLGEEILGYEQYSYKMIKTVEDKYLSKCFEEIECQLVLSKKQFIKLKGAISDNLIRAPKELGDKTYNHWMKEVENSEYIIKPLIQKYVCEDLNIDIKENDIKLKIERISKNDILVESNLHKDFKSHINLKSSHDIVQKALGSLINTNYKLETMELFNAKTILNNEDTLCVEKKLNFLVEKFFDVERKEKNFKRVLELKNYPKLEILPDIKIDIEKLMKIRESKNCIEFRNWINTVDNFEDKEIIEYLNSYSETIKNFADSKTGKTLRFLATTGVGALNPIAGIAVGIVDTFLIEKILSTSGSKIFLREDYPRIFKID